MQPCQTDCCDKLGGDLGELCSAFRTGYYCPPVQAPWRAIIFTERSPGFGDLAGTKARALLRKLPRQ